MHFILASERKKENLQYRVYYHALSPNGSVINTDNIDLAKPFLSENSAKYEIQNAGDNMKRQNYKVIPVIETNKS